MRGREPSMSQLPNLLPRKPPAKAVTNEIARSAGTCRNYKFLVHRWPMRLLDLHEVPMTKQQPSIILTQDCERSGKWQTR